MLLLNPVGLFPFLFLIFSFYRFLILKPEKNEIARDVFARQNFCKMLHWKEGNFLLTNLGVRVLLLYLAVQENVSTCSFKHNKEIIFFKECTKQNSCKFSHLNSLG